MDPTRKPNPKLSFYRGGVRRPIHLLGLCQVQTGRQVWRRRPELLQSGQGGFHWGDQVCTVDANFKNMAPLDLP